MQIFTFHEEEKMSVLIKGMEMPTNCHNCELLTRIEVTYGAVYACQILNEVIGNVMVRQIRCPLVEVDDNEIEENNEKRQ